MPSYNFKRDSKVYLAKTVSSVSYGFVLDVSDITFSQTLAEQSYSTKTLHQANYFESTVINKANPANFSISMDLKDNIQYYQLFKSAISLDYFDIYVEATDAIFKIENAVITSLSITSPRGKILGLSVEGEASKVAKVSILPAFSIQYGASQYVRSTDIQVIKDNTDISSNILSTTIELQNNIDWVPYTSVQNSGSIQYPTQYTIKDKSLAGSLQRYVDSSTSADLFSYSTSTPMVLKVGYKEGSSWYGITLDMLAVSFTNRLESGATFTQYYDWKLVDNTRALSSTFIFNPKN